MDSLREFGVRMLGLAPNHVEDLSEEESYVATFGARVMGNHNYGVWNLKRDMGQREITEERF